MSELNEPTRKCRTVLIVDDEPSICWSFARMLSEEGHRVLTASTAEEGISIAAKEQPSLVLLDVRLPNEDGITALPKFSQATGGSPIVVMTAFGDLDTAVAAVKQGAADYLTKPFRLDEARRICRKMIDQPHAAAETNASPESAETNKLIGRSPAMQHAFRQIALVAESDLSVLITGETGTGKELVAAAIHRHSSRCDQPYLPVALVALNEDLIESELFGHVKGAFTGAAEERVGLFEQGQGGTILLDEIGDLPIGLQAKLLRVLESGEFSRVGESKRRKCNVRIIAATNRDLHESIRQGAFREDLFYRLNGLHIHLPALRDRAGDIRPLCEYFLAQLGESGSPAQLSDELCDQLQTRPWSGNVRELRNAVQHAALIARGRALAIEDFPPSQATSGDQPAASGGELPVAVANWVREKLAAGEVESVYQELIGQIEPELFRQVLEFTNQNRANAAQVLGIHRGTLREKLKQYGIS